MPKPANPNGGYTKVRITNPGAARAAREHRKYMDERARYAPISASTPAQTPTDGSNNTTNTYSYNTP